MRLHSPLRLLQRLIAKIPNRGRHDGAIDVGERGRVTPQEEFFPNPERGRLIQSAFARLDHGFPAAALAIIDEALVDAPDDAELLYAKAATLLAWQRHREAAAVGMRACALGARHPMRFLTLGWICFQLGDLELAEGWMRDAVAAEPSSAPAHFGLGTVLQVAKRCDEAIEQFLRAIALQPDSRVCRINVGVCLIDSGDAEAAVSRFREAIAIDPDNPKGFTNLGVALGRLDRYSEALEAFEVAEALALASGEQTDNFINHAIHLRDDGRTTAAITIYEAKLSRQPSIDGHYGYSLALLTGGRMREGWHEYEFRWLREPSLSHRPRYSKPVWNGQSLQGKTILIACEQGFGDTIQFVRFAPNLKALGATVLLQVQRGLEMLAQGIRGVDRVIGGNETTANFDYYIHSMSIARVLGVGLDSIPQEVPYVSVDPVRVDHWSPALRVGDRLAVGLIWAGNPEHLRDRYRSIPLAALAPLFEVQEVDFISLQKGAAEQQVDQAGLDGRVVRIGPSLDDLTDAAAVVAQLDLVISVDTAIAHLAGALARPVWLMLPMPADWRWLEGRTDTPWYPTMTLYRQTRRMEWADVVARVADDLRGLCKRFDRRTRSTAVISKIPREVVPIEVVQCGQDLHYSHFGGVAETNGAIFQCLAEDAMSDSMRYYGEFLRPQLDLVTRFLKRGSTVLEVGAGIGAHAVYLARATGDDGHLFLYEDEPIKRQVLEQNLRVNGVKNATIMRRRVTKEGESGRAAGQRLGEPQALSGCDVESIDDLRLEQLSWLKTNVGVPSLDILESAVGTIWRLRPFLLLAASTHKALRELAARARDLSYQCYALETRYFDPSNFNRRVQDVFSGDGVASLVAIPEEIDIDVPLEGCSRLQ